MPYDYDDQNIFAKILRGEIPNNTVFETEHTLAFYDITPQAPVHVLVIPKSPYVCFDHFASEATDTEIADFNRSVATICQMTGVAPDEGGNGYRAIANCGTDGAQEVPHFHMHIVGGHTLGPMLSKP